MSLMGTLAKVAVGYAAARGVDALSGGRGLTALFGGGAQVDPDGAETDHAPGLGNMQDVINQMTSASGLGALQDMVSQFAGKAGLDLSALTGGAAGGLSAMAAMAGQGAGAMGDHTAKVAPQMEKDAALMLRAMIQASGCDGGIDKVEQEKILAAMGEDAEAEDVAFVKAQMKAPVDPDRLAADTPSHLAAQVYAMSLMPIRVDTEAEAKYLDRLAAGLALNQETVNMIHVQMGVKPLFG